ncbi:hypothetical protein C8F04DRAFT_1087737 [Mycena alexandri]|uniref:Uncharacterized protein n=1 Tax=Mycena alexandri TaxID=1745969 RepID=A0AAD6WPS5_9AGAR|nr:hypothetical protein C8F04DRAFT_1143396 [Mycena alexandri]KAJ7039266.1 hypothetical protein C8F04DRAFT_1087737 [Mycena alexandri]
MELSTDFCPVCQILYLTLPTPSTGHHTPGNKKRVYQKCPLNSFNDNSECRGFVWRDDLSPPPWGTISSMTPATTPTRPNSVRCVSALCAGSSKGRPGNSHCAQLFCKECCLSSSVQCRLSVHNNRPIIPSLTYDSPTLPLAPPAFAGPYARMIPPDYAHKIVHNNFTVASSSTRLQTEAYRMESQTMIKVKYWVKNDQSALTFSVPVANYPWFHPKACTTITSRLSALGLSCDHYEILDAVLNPLETTSEDDDEWINIGSATKVKANMTLYLRAPGVDRCLGLRPTMPHKRVLSQGEDSFTSGPPKTPSPAKRARREPSPSTPNTNDSDQNATPSSSPFPMITSSLTTPLSPTTPRGKYAPFPLAFACDMDAAFRQIGDLPKDWPARRHFEDVLGVLGLKFVPSTYSDNLSAWKDDSLKADIARAVARGHKGGGEWGPILKEHRARAKTNSS